ncbi:MAG: DUF411 domain-containing protein [Gemmatimonadaceae bacterium]|nr:DUF411 domain-containing protein [Gemmatimonadaceae bacterium]
MRIDTQIRLAAAAALLGAVACSTSKQSESAGGVDSAAVQPATASAVAPAPGDSTPRAALATKSDSVLVVYKTPTCGCCKGWVSKMKEAGFAVEVHDLPDLTQIKKKAGVPEDLQACHTARIGGYVVEGHVPAADIRRLLAERPKVTGIGTPGMPVGSPGMEGAFKDRYDVMTFGGGKQTVFASH